MRRRDFIAVLGLALFGGAATLWRNLGSFWQPRFNEHTAYTVKVVTDLMFPGDGGLPGATELKIHDRIIAMSDLHETMAYGVSWLDSWARTNGASDFLGLDENAKSAAIDAAFASEIEDARVFALTLRYHGVLNYYSEPQIKTAFPYTGPPQPEGFLDFQDPPQ
jgi:gluconate 2-dehydrogenase subunit 3-like protein